MKMTEIKQMVRDISKISRIPAKLIYTLFATAISTIFFSLSTLVFIAMIGIGSVTGFITFKAHAAKPDPCKIYQENALKHLDRLEVAKTRGARNVDMGYENASMSAAYSGYYLVCRDLESRESQ